MPNFSGSSVVPFDWPMAFNDCSTVKKRNLLENLHVQSDTISSTPMAPPFEQFISLNNSKDRSSLNSINSNDASSYQLAHQTPSPTLDRRNYNYSKIRARPLYNFQYNQSNIWTQSTSNMIHPLLNDASFDLNVMNKFFAKENKMKDDSFQSRSRSSSVSTTASSNSSIFMRPYQILHRSSQINYDVTMRHLMQLLNKFADRPASIDEVLKRIEDGSIPTEWLQCVQRLMKTLEKHGEDRERLEEFPLEKISDLNSVEQFFVKLFRVEDFDLKLKTYEFRDEIENQLKSLGQSIDLICQSIEAVLNDKYLPWMFQVLCFLYNLVSDKSVPGLDLISIEDALNSPTNQTNKNVAHVLAQILDDYYPEYLTSVLNDGRLPNLNKFSSMKIEQIYSEIREIHRKFIEIEQQFSKVRNFRPTNGFCDFIEPMINRNRSEFEKIFRQEIFIKRNAEELGKYFCATDLSVEFCLSTVGRFVEKISLAHQQNLREKRKKFKSFPNF